MNISEIEDRIRNKCPLTYRIMKRSLIVIRHEGHWLLFDYDYDKKCIISQLDRTTLSAFHNKNLRKLKQKLVQKYRHYPDHPIWHHINKLGVINKTQLTLDKVNEQIQITSSST